MGPSIILDKSAVQSIGKSALRVQSEYFYTAITPILVWEICGDIEKARLGKCEPDKVSELADKVHPFNSIATTDWRKLCIGELCGHRLQLGTGQARRPIVEGGHRVPHPGGGFGIVFDEQPESQALRRWGYGEWTSSDEMYAQEWRRASKNIDLEAVRRKYGPTVSRSSDLKALKEVVSQTLRDPSLQYYFLTVLLDEIRLKEPLRSQIARRWAGKASQFWQFQCPYARHCIRTLLTFYTSIGSGLIGTRSTNRVDLEYMLYTPFACVFVSGDEGTHAKLAPLLLDSDQRFVLARDFKAALDAHVEQAGALKSRADANPDDFEPSNDSLIRELWTAAWGKFRPPPSTWSSGNSSGREPSTKTIAQQFGEAMKVVHANPDKYPKRPPWPGV